MEARVREWGRALLHHGLIFSHIDKCDQVTVAGTAWVDWHWQTRSQQDDERWPFVVELLELLALLAHADQPAWRRLVGTFWSAAAKELSKAPATQVFELGCVVVVGKTGVLSPVFWRFLCDDIDDIVSDDYKVLRAQLESALSPPTKQQLCTKVRVHIYEDEVSYPELNLEPLVFEVVQLVALQSAIDKSPLRYTRNFQSLFRIQEVRVGRLCSCQKEFSKTCTGLRRVVTTATAPRYATTLHQFLALDGENTERSDFAPSRSLVGYQYAPQRTNDAVFSALLHSSSVHQFYYISYPDDLGGNALSTPVGDRFWRWIAVAVVSSHATNPIDDVSFECSDISREDAAALEQTLKSRDPLKVLFPEFTDATRTPSIIASRFRLADDDDDQDAAEVLTMPVPVHCADVFEANEASEWLSVLLPGWGKAWVHRSDATEGAGAMSHGTASPLPVSGVRSIKHLTISSRGDWEAAATIVRAVGNGLLSLVLRRGDLEDPLPTEWLRQVVYSCPRLSTLELYEFPIPSLDVIRRGFETGHCVFNRLVFDNGFVEEFQTSESQFFDNLADPDHAMTHHLKELVVIRRLTDAPLGLLTSIAAMLERNHALCELTEKLTLSASINPTEASLMAQIQGYDGSWLSYVDALPIENKLAFLSVITGRENGSSRLPSALLAMDSPIAELITQFAGDYNKRRVFIRCELLRARQQEADEADLREPVSPSPTV